MKYNSIRSFDPAVPVAGPPQTVTKLWNSTHHVFSQLHPGTTYQFLLRASTLKGFGPATAINVTTNISGNIPNMHTSYGQSIDLCVANIKSTFVFCNEYL